MKCVVGIDLGSTTTKAVLLDENGALVGRGITNSRSNYAVACAVARQEALTSVQMSRIRRVLEAWPGTAATAARALAVSMPEAARLEMYLDELSELRQEVLSLLARGAGGLQRGALEAAAREVLSEMQRGASALFLSGAPRRSDFFRDIASAAFMAGAEKVCARGEVSFDRLTGLFDRAILNVETRLSPCDFASLLRRAGDRAGDARGLLEGALAEISLDPLEEVAFVGTGYGRQTLPFAREAVRSEILCHGRGAHRLFPGTRTVLDIGGQDTKAIQVDPHGVVTSFQMNDRCAAGCGRYLGYIADELNLGLHELGPLALQATRAVRVNSTCTVFAGAELRDRLALGQRREDVLAGLHRAIMLRAMSLLARSGGISDEFTFTGGVCRNPMATKVLGELVAANYGEAIQLNVHPDSIFMGAWGAALFALDDLRAGQPRGLRFVDQPVADAGEPPCGRDEPAARTDAAQL